MTTRSNVTALAQRTASLAERLGASPEQVQLIKAQIAPDAPDDVIALYFARCQQLGADPLSRMMYVINRKRSVKNDDKWEKVDNWQLQASIDLFRAVAESHGEYAGQVGPFWCGDDAEWVDVWLRSTPPAAARVGILRNGFKEPLYAVATWNEYAQYGDKDRTKLSGLWTTMPALMLAKTAEALALRKAFPTKLSGLYTTDEMAQAGGEAVPAAPPANADAPSDPAAERAARAAAVASGETKPDGKALRKAYEALQMLGETRSMGHYLSENSGWMRPGAKPLQERSTAKVMLSAAETEAAYALINADIANRKPATVADLAEAGLIEGEAIVVEGKTGQTTLLPEPETGEVKYCDECGAQTAPKAAAEPHEATCSFAEKPALPKPTEANLALLRKELRALHGKDEEATAEWLYAAVGASSVDELAEQGADADCIMAIKRAKAQRVQENIGDS